MVARYTRGEAAGEALKWLSPAERFSIHARIIGTGQWGSGCLEPHLANTINNYNCCFISATLITYDNELGW